MELAHRIVNYDGSLPYRDPRLKRAFDKIVHYYGGGGETEQADFSERLLNLVDQIVEKEKELKSLQTTGDITQLIHAKSIRELHDAISECLSLTKRDVWLLFDNLDKGWPIHDRLVCFPVTQLELSTQQLQWHPTTAPHARLLTSLASVQEAAKCNVLGNEGALTWAVLFRP